MGYRSQVVIAIPKELLKKNSSILTHLEGFEIFQKEETYYFSASSLKWYDSYTDVKAVNDFIRDNSDEVGFVRVGEDAGDIEELGNNYEYDIYVETSINVPSVKEVKLKNVKLLFAKQ